MDHLGCWQVSVIHAVEKKHCQTWRTTFQVGWANKVEDFPLLGEQIMLIREVFSSTRIFPLPIEFCKMGPYQSHISHGQRTNLITYTSCLTHPDTTTECCYYHPHCNKDGIGWTNSSGYNAILGNRYIHQRFIRPFHYPGLQMCGGGKEPEEL